jgi:hypothetical protein
MPVGDIFTAAALLPFIAVEQRRLISNFGITLKMTVAVAFSQSAGPLI